MSKGKQQRKDSIGPEAKIHYEVRAVKFWSTAAPMYAEYGYATTRYVVGYLPMIFGASLHGEKTILACALDGIEPHFLGLDDSRWFQSAEDAMSAWNAAEPVDITPTAISRNVLRRDQPDIINKMELFRRL